MLSLFTTVIELITMREALIAYGFDQKQATIYIYLLQYRDKPAYIIAKETGIPRTTVYEVLEGLKKEGFISCWIKNGVKHYSAENPELIKHLIKMKEERITQVLPEMLMLFKSEMTFPSSKLYEGKDAVKQVFENILEIIKHKKLKRLYVFSDYHLTEQFPQYFKKWRQQKNKTKAYTYLIVPHGTPVNEDYTSNENRETRVMPESFPFDGSVDICGSHVAFFSFRDKEVYAITIDSAIIAEMLTRFFLYIWSTLEGTNLKIEPNT